ncbi:XF1762 family protein [Nonomuraea harbinensis]|uniref:XF1762 family protein n=1 Tax=Nonomuraea harbinensis TaxID=1286938 RepID=A0ABW1BP39_9ACTN|nr:XF1762 family protein [Nonomuraea harbinensis]
MIAPVTIQTARAFAAWTHPHLAPPADAEFVIGVHSGRGALVGVVFIDRPGRWALDDGRTAEITCLSTDGTPNACSALLGAAWRAIRSKGCRRLMAYTRTNEPDIRLLWEVTTFGGRS